MPARSSFLIPLCAALLTLLAPSVKAHSDGMDMSMDGPMDMAMGHMLPYLHFTPGDIVLFQGWVPSSKGAMAGTCIGLFLFALVERWIGACRGMMEAHWRKRAQIAQADRINLPLPGAEKNTLSSTRLRDTVALRNAPPFNPAHDLARGVLHAVHAAIQFAFMLVVMTYQVSFILSIVIGLGVGETLFGRFASSHGVHA